MDDRPAVPTGPLITLVYRVSPARRGELLAFLREAFPFYERHGGTRVALYESIDEPGLLLELVAYGSEAEYTADQVRVEQDPQTIAMLERWRGVLEGPVEVRRMRPVVV